MSKLIVGARAALFVLILGSPSLSASKEVKDGLYWQRAVPVKNNPAYEVSSGWRAVPKQGETVLAGHPDDLRTVRIDFGGKSPDRSVVLDIRKANGTDKGLVKSLVRFFWQPRYIGNNDAASALKLPWWAVSPRLELIPEPLHEAKSVVPETRKDYYPILPLQQVLIPMSLDRRSKGVKSLNELLGLWTKIGLRKTGKVQLLMEEGLDDPQYLIFAWCPESRPWISPELVSPAIDGLIKLEVFECLPLVDGQANVGRLPKGTWGRLKKGFDKGLNLLALGQEGFAMKAERNTPFYEVHLLRQKEGEPKYESPAKRTPGLSPGHPPPAWTQRFQVQPNWDQEAARHLVSLSVCSPEVWRTDRSSPDRAGPHLSVLFADPELWALPQ